MKKPFAWDSYSDQAALLQDRAYKKRMRKKEWFSLLKTFLTALIMLPLAWLAMPFAKRRATTSKHFFTLGVDASRYPNETLKMLQDLGVKSILIRIKLWDLQLDELQNFLTKLPPNTHVTLKIMQDREHIEDLELLKRDLRTIFSNIKADIYEIGTTINRAKWGFFSVKEYLEFYKVAYDLKQQEFHDIKLIGSGVIDFEFYYTATTLFNFCKCRYDGVSALLYVDRRGAPENTQYGFSLLDKISLLSSLVTLSPKTKKRIYITETNWPLSNTAPYAPTSETECVSEEEYAAYMLRYYILALASQQITFVSWHQLIAHGYGLVDKDLRKRKAYYAYKTMLKHLQSVQFLRLDIKRGYYIAQFLTQNDILLQIHWSLHEATLRNEEHFEVYSMTNKKINSKEIAIGVNPVYIYITKAVGEKVNCL